MSIKLKTLLKIFPRRTSISSILGVSRQAASVVVEFKDPKKVKLLYKASKKRLDEINQAFDEIEQGALQVQNDSRKKPK